jgi:hypothetical protein
MNENKSIFVLMDKLKDIPIEDYTLIPISVYEKTFNECKEAFLDTIEETKSITDKTIKMLFAFVTFIAAIGLYFFKSNASVMSYIIFGLITVINIGVAFWNIKGHQIIQSGTAPNYVLTSNFGSKEIDDIDKEKLFFKNIIEQYWKSVNKMDCINKKRVFLYDINLILSILITITASCYLGAIIPTNV